VPTHKVEPFTQSIAQFIRTSILFGDPSVKLSDETPLLTIIDSLGLMHLVAFLEEQFDIRIEDGDVTPDNFGTLASLGALVAKSAGGST
jgi:acyl carrier protein